MTQYPLSYRITLDTVARDDFKQVAACMDASGQLLAVTVQLTSTATGPRSMLPLAVTVQGACWNSCNGSFGIKWFFMLFVSAACVMNANSTMLTDRMIFFI